MKAEFVPSMSEYLRGLLQPMTSSALDPFGFKTLSKLSPMRVAWTAESRLLEAAARLTYDRNLAAVRKQPTELSFLDRGVVLPDTSVTERQQTLLLGAVQASNAVAGAIAEVGAFRGITTLALARATSKMVYAVDPFIGYGASEKDYAQFLRTTEKQPNIIHIRKTSGAAAVDFKQGSLSMVFIDGVHDFSNSWFDFCVWSHRVVTNGFVAFHDVDDHQGVTLTCARVLKMSTYKLWGYCPNLAIFRKIT
jgi:predicted O-methyltransferase YrrM